MDSETYDLQCQRVNELIYDEEKIVTPLSLACQLGITQIESKDLIDRFVKDYRALKTTDLQITHLLCGTSSKNNGLLVLLVKEADLEENKKMFSSISTEIVYSIQSGKQINLDLIAIVNSTYESSGNFLVSRNCIERTGFPSDSSTTIKIESEEIKSASNKDSQSQSQKQKPKSNIGIASFFEKSSPKTKQHVAVKDESQKLSDKTQTIEMDTTNGQNDLKVKHSPENGSGKKVEAMEVDEKVKSKNGGQNSKKRKKASKDDAPSKRRKRIQQMSDSDSSDIFEDNDVEEDIIEKSDEEPEPVAVKAILPPPKGKKRKTVDKTYVDDEGFFVTKTEFIYETASEDEEPPKAPEPQKVLVEKRNEKANSQTQPRQSKGKGQKKMQNSKQPTLMSFFKKS